MLAPFVFRASISLHPWTPAISSDPKDAPVLAYHEKLCGLSQLMLASLTISTRHVLVAYNFAAELCANSSGSNDWKTQVAPCSCQTHAHRRQFFTRNWEDLQKLQQIPVIDPETLLKQIRPRHSFSSQNLPLNYSSPLYLVAELHNLCSNPFIFHTSKAHQHRKAHLSNLEWHHAPREREICNLQILEKYLAIKFARFISCCFSCTILSQMNSMLAARDRNMPTEIPRNVVPNHSLSRLFLLPLYITPYVH